VTGFELLPKMAVFWGRYRIWTCDKT